MNITVFPNAIYAVVLILLLLASIDFINKQHIECRKKLKNPMHLLSFFIVFLIIYILYDFIINAPILVALLTTSISFFGFNINALPMFKVDNEMKVGIAIPSKTEFNDEIIIELQKGLEIIPKKFQDKIFQNKIKVDDKDYSAQKKIASVEHYEFFDEILNEAVLHNPDYLVIHCPNKDYANKYNETFLKLLKQRTKIIFIETCPDDIEETRRAFKNKIFKIYFDSDMGAKILSDKIKNHFQGRITLVNGPKNSENAKLRAKILQSSLGDMIIDSYFSASWLPSSGRDVMASCKSGNNDNLPDMIICGNDNIAIKVCDYLNENSLLDKKIKVVGFDGIKTARERIRTPESSFWATLVIPPKEYGKRAIQLICSDMENGNKGNGESWVSTISPTENSFLTEPDF